VTSIQDIDQRWRLLLPAGTVVVTNAVRADTLAALRALPPETPVAVVGGRRLGRLARRGGVAVDTRYVVMPSLSTPVAIVQVADGPLRWVTRSVLTAPSGLRRGHAAFWWAVRVVRAFPRLLSAAPAGDRIAVGVRR
jgi:hypothetical protein